VVRRAAASGVLSNQLAQVQLVDDFHHKAGQVILRQPFIDRRRQQVRGLSIYGNEAAHAMGIVLRVTQLSGQSHALRSWESPTGS
jgi:hypothetical protein